MISKLLYQRNQYSTKGSLYTGGGIYSNRIPSGSPLTPEIELKANDGSFLLANNGDQLLANS